MALLGMLAEQAQAAAPNAERRAPNVDPLLPKVPHFPRGPKRIVFVFMKGGPSHVDTFDPKPLLDRDHGKPLPFEKPRVQFAGTGNLLKSRGPSRRTGRAGSRSASSSPTSRSTLTIFAS